MTTSSENRTSGTFDRLSKFFLEIQIKFSIDQQSINNFHGVKETFRETIIHNSGCITRKTKSTVFAVSVNLNLQTKQLLPIKDCFEPPLITGTKMMETKGGLGIISYGENKIS